MTGTMNKRLFGWCGSRLGSCDTAFEVNDRYPSDSLNMSRLKLLGSTVAEGLYTWCQSDTGKKWHETVVKSLATRAKSRKDYFFKKGYGPDSRTDVDIVTFGY